MKIIDIYRQISGSALQSSEFDLIENQNSGDFLFRVIDDPGVLNNAEGWFFGELLPAMDKVKIFVSLPANASIQEVLQVIKDLKSGLVNSTGTGTGSSVVKARKEDYLVDLGSQNSGEYRGLFPVITIANAPPWLVNLLNTLIGHGTLSLYLWIGITVIIGSKMAMNKKRSAVCWLILGFCAKMTYDAYRYKNDSTNKISA